MTSDERRAARLFGRVGLVAAIGAAIVLWLALSPLLAAPSLTLAPGAAAPSGSALAAAANPSGSPSAVDSGRPAATVSASGSARTAPGTSKPVASPAAKPSGSSRASASSSRPSGAPSAAASPGAPAVAHRARRSSATPLMKAALDRELGQLRAKLGIPGVSAAILFPDGTKWTGTSGLADVAARRPVTPETPFAVGSISKTFTAALVVALAGEGRVDLDASVLTYLPSLKVDARITVRDLLDHTSGLNDFFFHPKIDAALLADPGKTWLPADSLRYVGKPYFKPGRGYHYSNTNYLVLGMLAEAVGGAPIGEQIRSRFIDPPRSHRHDLPGHPRSDRCPGPRLSIRRHRPEAAPDRPHGHLLDHAVPVSRDRSRWGRIHRDDRDGPRSLGPRAVRRRCAERAVTPGDARRRRPHIDLRTRHRIRTRRPVRPPRRPPDVRPLGPASWLAGGHALAPDGVDVDRRPHEPEPDRSTGDRAPAAPDRPDRCRPTARPAPAAGRTFGGDPYPVPPTVAKGTVGSTARRRDDGAFDEHIRAELMLGFFFSVPSSTKRSTGSAPGADRGQPLRPASARAGRRTGLR